MGKNRGFTLIELIVTMIVLAIVASIATPRIQSVREKQKTDYTTKDLEKTLLQARYDAVLHRQRITVNLGQIGQSTTQTLYWSVIEGQTLGYIKFTCASSKWEGTPVAGVDKLVFSVDGTAQLSRGFKDDDGNDKREDVTLSAIEVVISNGNITNYVEITPLGKITAKKQSRQGQECS
ncbi:pilus assembly FimT family protein [Acinetobacter sp.]|uniref:pilus assembly FimT family protein n=1 Tax=Acinetobacter sp. TaxID=472 RepID=UPI002FD882ED